MRYGFKLLTLMNMCRCFVIVLLLFCTSCAHWDGYDVALMGSYVIASGADVYYNESKK